MPDFNPSACHDRLLDAAARTLAFKPGQPLEPWRRTLAAKLREVVGQQPPAVKPDLRVEWAKERDTYLERRLVFTAEPGADVPCHLLTPLAGKPPHPVMICLQGHSTGMHISLGTPKYEKDADSIAGGRDFAVQAVAQGYAALALEQRCFGERRDESKGGNNGGPTCLHATLASLLLGRTMIGERVWDVSRAIDVMAGFPEVDTERIGIMGNSGGGTITWYASCLDPRIKAAMPSCAVCTYGDSIGRIVHCADNYLPGALRWFDMGDLAGLIAPRPLVVVAGKDDGIFPLHGVQATFETIKGIYRAADAADRCELVIGPEGHRFYPEQAWPVFKKVTGW